jgi:hypothetical protein
VNYVAIPHERALRVIPVTMVFRFGTNGNVRDIICQVAPIVHYFQCEELIGRIKAQVSARIKLAMHDEGLLSSARHLGDPPSNLFSLDIAD